MTLFQLQAERNSSGALMKSSTSTLSSRFANPDEGLIRGFISQIFHQHQEAFHG